MKVIVDSGSTKADWIVLDESKQLDFQSAGLNPLFVDERKIYKILNTLPELIGLAPKVSSLFFYGAGCVSDELNSIIEKGLKKIFSNARIEVYSDLLAAAHACYNGEPEIVCILGTGSNVCSFDGEKLIQEKPSLGYVLGDEASGNYFGKQLIKHYFYKKLPLEIERELLELGLTRETLIKSVYTQANPNQYLASFFPLVHKYKSSPIVQSFILDGIRLFMEEHIKCYTHYRTTEVNFVGSVAFLLEEELRKVAKQEGILIGRIIKSPANRLVDYHEKK